jgi:hypothetical protein
MRTWFWTAVLLALVNAGPDSARAVVMRLSPCDDAADGVEFSNSFWLSDGPPELDGKLALGFQEFGSPYEPAMRFQVNGLARGDSVAYARLRFTTLGGDLLDTLRMAYRGLYHCTARPFSQDFRPSQIPATNAVVEWALLDPWGYGPAYDPLYTFGPDLSPLVNEILASDHWPVLPTGAFLSLSLDLQPATGRRSQFCKFADTGSVWAPVLLEIYPQLADAFLAFPGLGRVESGGATINFAHMATVDCYFVYGIAPGAYLWAQGVTRTLLPEVDPMRDVHGGAACEIELSDLEPDTQYYGQLCFSRPGRETYHTSAEFTFRTQRAPGAAFCFDIVADPHLEMKQDAHLDRDIDLYRTALRNVGGDAPDFWIGMGDFAITLEAGTGVRSIEEARRIYIEERNFEAEAMGAIPFYLVLGNHEGEVGWLDFGGDGIYRWSWMARTEFVPNPRPTGFYSGNRGSDLRIPPPEDYYAWEWGDALFVVLDPFRPTVNKPHNYGGAGSRDGWDWTLGREQYDWLLQVLEASTRSWKFVFIHHLVGGVLEPVWGPYGRGGTEAVKYDVAGRPSFEWGGEDTLGVDVFAAQRPGWNAGPIHDMLRDHGVTAVFHGHDHCYVQQSLDGVVYQECPMPSDANYGPGLWGSGAYEHGARLDNSGHLRVAVSPDEVRVEYVRAYLPGEGSNGHVERTYVISAGASSASTPLPVVPSLRLRPNPARGMVWIDAAYSSGTPAWLSVHDVAGRTVGTRVLPRRAPGAPLPWEPRDAAGRPLSSGIYQVRLHSAEGIEERRLLWVR